MFRFVLAIVLISLLTQTAAAADLQPFHAEYRTLRNGQEAGRTVLDLQRDDASGWVFRSETEGTRGLARVAGVQVDETSHLRIRDGRLETTAWEYRQKAAVKSRRRGAEFDWAAGELRWQEKDRSERHPLQPGTLDRQSVTLALMRDLGRGDARHTYPLAARDGVHPVRYERGETRRVEVPAGEFQAVEFRRVTADGGDRRRRLTVWLAPELGGLPVRFEQVEKDGSTVTLELVAHR